ncbi:MAG: Smr/MutS family protein [Dehalococcoidia bacterium]|nr:Smr/MutS family protein [Dehalococcoidia bacterium]
MAAFVSEVESLRRKQGRGGFDPAAAEQTLRELDEGIERLKTGAKPRRRYQAETPPAVRELQPGDRIHVRDIPQVGEAISGIGEDGLVDAQFGALRMKVSVDRITKVESVSGGEQVRLPEAATPALAPNISPELDLRGQRAEEAVNRFESYVDEAFRAGLPYVRVIHGKGTGALRMAIREAMRENSLAKTRARSKTKAAMV